MDRTFKEVARDLRVATSTLNGWLGADARRPPQERRLHFHAFRGRRRFWSPHAFEQLKAAIERESAPGGVLGGWRSGHGATEIATPSAEEALREVMNYKPGRRIIDDCDGAETACAPIRGGP